MSTFHHTGTASEPGASPFPEYGGLGRKVRHLFAWDGHGPDAAEWTRPCTIVETYGDGTVLVAGHHDGGGNWAQRVPRDELRFHEDHQVADGDPGPPTLRNLLRF